MESTRVSKIITHKRNMNCINSDHPIFYEINSLVVYTEKSRYMYATCIHVFAKQLLQLKYFCKSFRIN